MSETPTDGAEVYPPSAKVPKSVMTIALLGLIAITGVAVVALAYVAIVKDGSTDALTTMGALGLGSLATLIGVRNTTPK